MVLECERAREDLNLEVMCPRRDGSSKEKGDTSWVVALFPELTKTTRTTWMTMKSNKAEMEWRYGRIFIVWYELCQKPPSIDRRRLTRTGKIGGRGPETKICQDGQDVNEVVPTVRYGGYRCCR